MHITRVYQAALPGAPETTASLSGNTLTINGIVYDLSGPEIDVPEDHPFIGEIDMDEGNNLHVSILWQYDSTRVESPMENTSVEVTDGPVPDGLTPKPVVQEPTE